MFAVVLGVIRLVDHAGWSVSSRVPVSVGLLLTGLFGTLAVWTSRLDVVGRELVAEHFYATRSLRLESIVMAKPGLLFGIVIKSDDRTKMLSLVSGHTFPNESWAVRAEAICDQILRHARAARFEGV